MKKIVIVNDASVARGGATGLALLQARMLRERGYEVTYIAGDDGGNDSLRPLGIELRAVGGAALMKAPPLVSATRGFYSVSARDAVSAAIDAEDGPDTVYHVHSFAKALSPSIFSALRPVAERCFIHAHDFFLACPNGGFMDYRRMEPCKRVPLSADCLCTNCDKRNYSQKLWRAGRHAVLHRVMPRTAPWAGVLLIHPGMQPYMEKAGYPAEVLHTLRNPARAFRSERVEAETNKRLFFIGRVEAEKGIEELIAAAGRAGAALTVIGEGPLLSELRSRHPEVDFLGWMEREQIAEAIADARALVMSTRYPEPFGLVAAEASLSGLPVVLSETALLGPEMAQHGLGLICNPRDPTGFAATLHEMVEMSAERVAEMSRRGFSGEAGLCTSPEQWIDMQEALYDGVRAAA